MAPKIKTLSTVGVPSANNDSFVIHHDRQLNVLAPGVLGNDLDTGGNNLSATLDTDVSSGRLTFNSDGSFTYRPISGFVGIDTFTYLANGGPAGNSTGAVMIQVINSQPVANNDSYTVHHDRTLDVPAPGVLGNDSDPDGDDLTAVLVSDVTHGTLSLNPDGSFTYKANTGFVGLDSFTYKASDGAAESAAATVTIQVTNSPPIANNDSYTILHDHTLSVPAPGVLGNDSDADGDDLTPILVSNVSHGSLTLNTDGSFTYTPVAGFVGIDSFTYKASDGVAESGTVTVAIQVTNSPPVANNDSYTMVHDRTLDIPAPGVLGNDSDPDGDDLTAILVSNVSHGNLSLNPNGSFTYTPNAGFVGTDSFSYQASDGAAQSAAVSVVIAVTNNPPVANNDSYTMLHDRTLDVPAPGVLGNDSDPDGDDLTALLVSSVSHGLLTLNGDGSFSYVPNAGFFGNDSFSYKASDGAAQSATATVVIQVTNHAPVANNDSYTMVHDRTLDVPAPGVLGNDTDADGDNLTASVVSNVNHGSLTLNPDGSFTYTPNAGFVGTDSFSYQASDGAQNSTASVTIQVTNKAPWANNDSYTVPQDQTLDVPAPGVLGNDSDPDGDNLSAVLVSGVGHGSLTLSSDGSFTYTPTSGFTGIDVFTYKANDGAAQSAAATVMIQVM